MRPASGRLSHMNLSLRYHRQFQFQHLCRLRRARLVTNQQVRRLGRHPAANLGAVVLHEVGKVTALPGQRPSDHPHLAGQPLRRRRLLLHDELQSVLSYQSTPQHVVGGFAEPCHHVSGSDFANTVALAQAVLSSSRQLLNGAVNLEQLLGRVAADTGDTETGEHTPGRL